MNYRDIESKVAVTIRWIVVVLVALATGFVVWAWMRQPDPVPDGYAPAVVQADGSMIAERKPDPKAQPPHMVPKGAKVERLVSVTVQPRANTGIQAGGENRGNGLTLNRQGGFNHLPDAGEMVCPPVTIDLSLVRMPDQTRRVVASSPDGTVVSGLDVPVDTPAPPRSHPWAVGLSYDPMKQTPGAWIERDVGRVRVGLEFNQTRQRIGGPTGTETRLKAGLTF